MLTFLLVISSSFTSPASDLYLSIVLLHVFHHALPGYLCYDLERVQKRALSIISLGLSYTDNLNTHNISTLKDRRQKLCQKLFQTVVSDPDHKLHHLLLRNNTSIYNLRRQRRFDCPATGTNRFRRQKHLYSVKGPSS